MKNRSDFKNFIWNAIGLTLNSFNSLFFLMAINRINGLNDSGIFTYAFALCTTTFYFSVFYNRTFQVSDYNKKYSFNQYFSLRVITIIISLLFVILFSLVNGFDMYKLLVIVFLMIFKCIEAMSECFYAVLQSDEKLYKTGISLSVKTFIGFSLFVIIDILTKSMILSLLSYCIFDLLVMYFYDYKEMKKVNNIKLKIDNSKMGKIIKDTYSLCIFTILCVYIINVQKYVMTYYSSNELQSIFGMIIMPGTIVSLLGNYILYPFVSKISNNLKDSNYNNIIKITVMICLSLLVIGLVMIVVLFFIGIPILNIIYGVDLIDYKIPFLILFIGAIFSAVSIILSNVLTILRDNKNQLYIYGFISIITTIVSVLLINNSGVIGASISYLVSQIICLLLFICLYVIDIKKLRRGELK